MRVTRVPGSEPSIDIPAIPAVDDGPENITVATEDEQAAASEALHTSAAVSRARNGDEHWMEVIQARELAASNILAEREQAKLIEAALLQRKALAVAAETAKAAKIEQRKADIEEMRAKNQGDDVCYGYHRNYKLNAL